MPGALPLNQLQMLTPQHQQQLLLAQQNLTSPSANDSESRRLRMLLSSRSMNLGKGVLTNSVSDMVFNVGSALQAGLPRGGDPDMLLKLKMAQVQLQHQHQQQNINQQQHALSGQQSQSSNLNLRQQDKSVGGVPADGSISNSYRGNKQIKRGVCGFYGVVMVLVEAKSY